MVKCDDHFAHRAVGVLTAGTAGRCQAKCNLFGTESQAPDVKNATLIDRHLHASSVARQES